MHHSYGGQGWRAPLLLISGSTNLLVSAFNVKQAKARNHTGVGSVLVQCLSGLYGPTCKNCFVLAEGLMHTATFFIGLL